jgi:tRNA G18 (ribose-2'-O)-methylase SpoU
VTNADNVGGVFRNVAAFGAGGVMLSPTCCDPFYRKAIRTSMGATVRVPFARFDDWPGGLEDVRATGFTLVALSPRGPSTTLDALVESRPTRVALLLGSEGEGLSEAALSAADLSVRIPITDAVDSLNLAVASGIALSRLSDEGRL